MHILGFVLLGLLILLLVSGIYTFVVACVRTRERPWLEHQGLEGSSYEQYAPLIRQSHAWLQRMAARDVYVTSHDGLKLHGFWVPAQNAKGTILLCHGYRSTLLVDFGKVMELYHNLGLNLLLPQQRAHGSSQGRFITFGVLESRDMLRWLDYHNAALAQCPVILSGLSMGASTVLYMADEPLPENVRGIIADCGFTSPAAIIGKVFRSVIHLPPQPTLFVADLLARIFAGFSLYAKDSRKTLAKNRLPILMVHGTGDDFVPCDMTRQGFAACTAEKTLLLVDDAGHGLSFVKEPQRYQAAVLEFLKQNLEGFS